THWCAQRTTREPVKVKLSKGRSLSRSETIRFIWGCAPTLMNLSGVLPSSASEVNISQNSFGCFSRSIRISSELLSELFKNRGQNVNKLANMLSSLTQ